MKISRYLLFTLLLSVVDLCYTNPLTQMERKDNSALSQSYAEFRSSLISDVTYDLSMTVGTGDTFSGTIVSGFTLKAPLSFTVDFNDGSVSELAVNGKMLKEVSYNGKFLRIPKKVLKTGKNKLLVRYKAPYSKTGSGLYKFHDPEDNTHYIYSDFEPYDANFMFPCFDQPDLKARFTLSVTAPSSWVVVSTSKGNTARTDKKTDISIWAFNETPPISTYIFSLIAGPYKIWTSKAGKTDLRLMCRQSMARYVNADDWFRPTIAGLKFFNDYFAYDYPFEKYDQIIVPDFNPGAMENAGAVTFNERYISRGDESRRLKMRRASVILHEMAHMWFGDLVTMKWWDGLWLNESFATYMAAIALYESTEFKEAWQRFYSGMKQWAYWEDQLVTTHPIDLPVASTKEAFTNFDGITYGKGAASLKQLAYYLGADIFRLGVRKYFKKYAFKNTTLPDFMGAMESAANKKLTEWTESWLKKTGLNTISTNYKCQDGKIQSVTVKQTAPDRFPTIRSHKAQLGLFYPSKSGSIVLRDSVPVLITREGQTIDTLMGKPCPAILYPNYGDYGYFKVQMDEASLVTAMKKLNLISDTFTRTMIWKNLWEMTADAVMPLNEYINLVFNNLAKEKNYSIISSVLDDIQSHAGYFFFTEKKDSLVNRYYHVNLKTLEKLMWGALHEATPGSEVQKVWMDHYISGVYSKEGIQNLKGLLSGKITIKGITVDQDRRWAIIIRLSTLGDTTVQSLTAKELKRDNSSRGRRAAISVEAAFPDISTKKRWFSLIQNLDTAMALADKKAAIYHLFPLNQLELRKPFIDAFFDFLPTLFKEKDQILRYYLALGPTQCNQESVGRIKKFLSDHPEAPPIVIKKLKILAQLTERSMKVQALARKGID